MSSQDEVQTELLREILKWTKFSGMKAVKDVLNIALDTPQKKLAYQLSDGDRGSVEVCKASGIASTETMTKYWKSWAKLGLGENLPVKGGKRFKRSFDLEDLGIDFPEPKLLREQQQAPDSEKSNNTEQPKEES